MQSFFLLTHLNFKPRKGTVRKVEINLFSIEMPVHFEQASEILSQVPWKLGLTEASWLM